MLSETKNVSWMDGIVVPHPGRDKWLEELRPSNGQARQDPTNLSEGDKRRIEGDVKWTTEAMEIVRASGALACLENRRILPNTRPPRVQI